LHENSFLLPVFSTFPCVYIKEIYLEIQLVENSVENVKNTLSQADFSFHSSFFLRQFMLTASFCALSGPFFGHFSFTPFFRNIRYDKTFLHLHFVSIPFLGQTFFPGFFPHSLCSLSSLQQNSLSGKKCYLFLQIYGILRKNQ